jgi:rare lipoprotein A
MSKLSFLIMLLISCGSSASLRNKYHKNQDLHKIEQDGKIIRGVASYYAEKYHGRTTANGEVFDMNALTCAHKKLPFNTKLKVTYLKTSKSVVVRVNDRGPFKKNRILDLSKEAAKVIGLFEDGVGEVLIEIL